MSLPFCPPPWVRRRPRRGARHVPAVRRRRIPLLRFSGKLPARKGRTRLRQFECPAGSVQKRSRPSGANTPAAVRVPRSAGVEKEPPGKGEHANAVRAPRLSGAEKEPPRQGEHANAVRAPRLSGAEKEPPGKGEHADAVRVPRSANAENPGNPEKIFPPEKTAKTPILTPRKRLSKRYS